MKSNAIAGGGTNIKMAYSSAFDLFDPYIKEPGMYWTEPIILTTIKISNFEF